MAESLSISKSVARAFAVLELFQSGREPLTAATIGRQLDIPQPSIRALLKTLVALGYLTCNATDRTYWPTGALTILGQWLATEQRLPAGFARTLDRIAALAEETTSLCGLRDGNVHILYVRKAQHPVALQLETGVGAAAWRTAVGRALLAALPDAEATDRLAGWLRQERTPAGRRTLEVLPRELKRARADGFLAGYNVFLKGVGTLCVPVPERGLAGLNAPAVVAVAGLSDRIRARELPLLRMIRHELRRPLEGRL